MNDTWTNLFRRLAVAGVVAGATAWSSAQCFAQIAFDSADDAAYANGWQEGDDGGTGTFGPWVFDGTYASAVQQRMDDGLGAGVAGSSTFNNLGKAWSLFNPAAGDFARAGRSMSPLLVGQTVRIVIDNPTARQQLRGYSVKFNTGGGNACTTGCTPGAVLKYKVERLENDNNGLWSDTNGPFGMFDTNTDLGARIDFKLSSATAYEMRMTPLDDPAAGVMITGLLANPVTTSPINWIEFQFFNTQSNASLSSDFFIKSMSILAAPAAVPGDYSRNNIVDAADYVLWRDRLGQNFLLQNEVAGVTPGMVTIEDYTAWKARFGRTSGTGAVTDSTFAMVPEASTLAYLVAVLVCTCAAALRRIGIHL